MIAILSLTRLKGSVDCLALLNQFSELSIFDAALVVTVHR